jgi:hypothetical protein
MIGVMNNTKWEGLRAAMYELGSLHPQFRIKDREREEPWLWDGEWFYHFRRDAYETIEYVDLKVTSQEQRVAVRDRLRAIHLPGVETEEGFRIYGWIKPGEFVDYLK